METLAPYPLNTSIKKEFNLPLLEQALDQFIKGWMKGTLRFHESYVTVTQDIHFTKPSISPQVACSDNVYTCSFDLALQGKLTISLCHHKMVIHYYNGLNQLMKTQCLPVLMSDLASLSK